MTKVYLLVWLLFFIIAIISIETFLLPLITNIMFFAISRFSNGSGGSSSGGYRSRSSSSRSSSSRSFSGGGGRSSGGGSSRRF